MTKELTCLCAHTSRCMYVLFIVVLLLISDVTASRTLWHGVLITSVLPGDKGSFDKSSLTTQNKDDDDSHRANVVNRSRRQPPPSNRKKQSWTSKFAQESLRLTSKVVKGTVQTTGQAAYALMRPKHVELDELYGLWRLDQQLDSDLDGDTFHANIELTRDGLVVVVMQNGRLYKHPFTFVSRQWPKACKLEFVARAFLRPGASEPDLYFYKGYTYRKLADSSVIKIIGKIYRLEKQGMWRSKKVKHVQVGDFVARRRLKLNIDDDVSEEEEEDNDDENDSHEEDEEGEDKSVSDHPIQSLDHQGDEDEYEYSDEDADLDNNAEDDTDRI